MMVLLVMQSMGGRFAGRTANSAGRRCGSCGRHQAGVRGHGTAVGTVREVRVA